MDIVERDCCLEFTLRTEIVREYRTLRSAAAKMGFSKWCFSVGPGGAHMGPYGPVWAHVGPYAPHAKTPCTKPILAAADRHAYMRTHVHTHTRHHMTIGTRSEHAHACLI